MNLMKFCLTLIFRGYCLGVSVDVGPGFYLEGSVKNLPSFRVDDLPFFAQLNIKLYMKRSGSKNYLYKKIEKNNKSVSFFQQDDTIFYTLIISDKEKKIWYEKLEDLSIFNMFEIRKGNVNISIPNLFTYGEEHSGSTKTHKDFYEKIIDDILYQLSNIFLCAIPKPSKFYKRKEESYRNLVRFNYRNRFSNRDIFCAREFLISYLNILKCYEGKKIEKGDKNYKEFEKTYLRKEIKTFIGDYKESSSSYSIEELKLYTQRCFDIWNEIILFQNFTDYYYYRVLPRNDNNVKFTMKTKKCVLFTFNLKGYNEEKKKICKTDLKFYNIDGYSLSINFNNIIIFNDVCWDIKHVAIDYEEIKKKSVNKIIIEKLNVVVRNFMTDLSQ